MSEDNSLSKTLESIVDLVVALDKKLEASHNGSVTRFEDVASLFKSNLKLVQSLNERLIVLEEKECPPNQESQ